MTIQQGIIFATLLTTMVLFVTGRWRYDIVALIALLVVTLTGLVPASRAFNGFGNPAVITVAAVLVLSRGLQNSGIVEQLGKLLDHVEGGIITQLSVLTSIVAILSAFMNNVGALALLLPVVLQLARKKQISPSLLLMPLAFASLLGGMTTLIGTPPNIIAASFRQQTGAPSFGMFDFFPVGAGVAVIGLIFIVTVGWRFIPKRVNKAGSENPFDIENYITEVQIQKESGLVGKRLREASLFSRNGINILGLVRGNERRMEPSAMIRLQVDDILIISADAESLGVLVDSGGVKLVGSKKIEKADLDSDDVTMMEVVIMPDSLMLGGTARSLNLRSNFGVNLLAVSRQGKVLRNRLDRIRFQTGDVLLMQSHVETSREVIHSLGCLPLAGRAIRIGNSPNMFIAIAIFITALLISAMGWLSVQVSLLAAVVLMAIFKIVSLRDIYESVDWPIIILLGAMIPVGEALESTGGAQVIAGLFINSSGDASPLVLLVIALVITMFLSDIINNAAAVVLMAPIGIRVAQELNVSADPFLIAIALGASCAFLTPIGHQSNTLVMGPGGYRFGDYWRMGLLLEIVIIVVAIPLILIVWPF